MTVERGGGTAAEHDPSPAVGVARAWLMGSAVAAVALLASSRGDVREMAYGDGLIYRYVAMNLSIDPDDVDPVVSSRGTSLRYGRAGLPFAIWVASGGRPSLMRYAQPAIVVVAAGGASAAAVVLFPGAGLLAPFLPFLAPGFPLSVAGGYAEALAVPLALWTVVLAARGRFWPATALLAGAILTRENVGAVLVGLLLWEALTKRRRSAMILLASLVPVGVWHVIVAARYGHLPLLDPYLRVVTDTIDTPFVAVARSLTTGSAASIVTAALHVGLAVAGFALWRSSRLGALAAASALQVLSAGPFAWRFPGDAVRATVFLELFVIAALVWRYRPDARAPADGTA